MAANVENVTLEILKAIQTSISDLRNEMNDRFAATHQHFDQFKDKARKDRRNINGLMTLLQAASGVSTNEFARSTTGSRSWKTARAGQ